MIPRSWSAETSIDTTKELVKRFIRYVGFWLD